MVQGPIRTPGASCVRSGQWCGVHEVRFGASTRAVVQSRVAARVHCHEEGSMQLEAEHTAEDRVAGQVWGCLGVQVGQQGWSQDDR